MGREIRRVPPGWEHPKDYRGYYQPLLDEDYETRAREWMKDYAEFLADNPSGQNEEGCFFWDWDRMPPDQDSFRPKWTTEPTAYQIYENVSEGTPLSPVFETVDALRAWLISEAELSEEGADDFIKRGWSFSGIKGPGILSFGWCAAEDMRKLFPDKGD